MEAVEGSAPDVQLALTACRQDSASVGDGFISKRLRRADVDEGNKSRQRGKEGGQLGIEVGR